MNWLSKEEIKKRSTSAYEAFTVSIEKYEQWLCATEEELEEVIGDETDLTIEWCGLCQFYDTAGSCPLNSKCNCKHGQYRCCKEWHALRDSLNKDSIRSMLCRLYQERNKLEKKKEEPKKEKAKPEIRHGDWRIGEEEGGFQFFVLDDKSEKIRLCQKNYMFPGPVDDWRLIKDIVDSGNFIDDFEALKEPLEKFTVSSCGAFFTAESRKHDVKISVEGGYFLHKDIPEIILNLRRLVATAKSRDC